MRKMTQIQLIAICICLVCVCSVQADVWFVETEAFDEEKSILQALGTWSVKDDDKDVLGGRDGKYMTVQGANRDNCLACSPLYYPISQIREAGPYQLWARSIMATTASDSFYWQISTDGGNKFTEPAEAHGGAQWVEWEWKRPWDGIQLKRGSDNVLIIAERENNAKFDVFCLRNDNQVPTDEEALAWLEENREGIRAVEAQQKLSIIWGKIKQQ